MKRFALLWGGLWMVFVSSWAQLTVEGTPLSFQRGIPFEEDAIALAAPVNARAASLLASGGMEIVPLLIGESIDIHKTPDQIGSWMKTSDGSLIWRVALSAPNASSLAVVFSKFHLPDNALLYLYNADRSEVVGAFSAQNNSPYRLLSAQGVEGCTIIIELNIIQPRTYDLELEIGELVYHYPFIDSSRQTKSIPGAGDCFLSVNCSPEGKYRQKQKRGVARVEFKDVDNKWYVCSGSLVNTTKQDGDPLFLTADHCGSGASAEYKLLWKFVFNDEYVDCGTTIKTKTATLSGCKMVASTPVLDGTDFLLLRLNTTPPASINPYYNGWDRKEFRNTPAWDSCTCIHHPGGYEKAISTAYTPLTYTTPIIDGKKGKAGAYWSAIWSRTTNGHSVTMGGSSGSPLFNKEGLIVGTLTGGASGCLNPTSPDVFGCFDMHWAANALHPDDPIPTAADSARQLACWLDPIHPVGSKVMKLGAYDPYPLSIEETSMDSMPVLTYRGYPGGVVLTYLGNEAVAATIYTADGQLIQSLLLLPGENVLSLPGQFYVIKAGALSLKIAL